MNPAGGTAAEKLLAETLARLPPDQHGFLLPVGPSRTVPLSQVYDDDWLAEQLRLQSRRFPSVDRRTLATLWWYGISQVFITPTVASLFVAGQALSPRPADVELHVLPDGLVLTCRSTSVLDVDGGSVNSVLGSHGQIAAVAMVLRSSITGVVSAVARAGRMPQLPLWAIATDSLASRLLWVGQACGEVERATELCDQLVESIGAPMPRSRFVDVEPSGSRRTSVRFVRRGSCCLIYLEPSELKCTSCPRQTPATRSQRLRAAADLF